MRHRSSPWHVTAAISLIAAAGIVTAYLPASTRAAPALCTSGEECRQLVDVGDGLNMPVYATYSLSQDNNAITRVVFAVHGRARRADKNMENMAATAERAGLLRNTLIIAPHFSNRDDRDDRAAGELYWQRARWSMGGLSVKQIGPRISSFDVMDRLRIHVLHRKRFPRVTRMVVFGFSGGGQFAQRYAVGHRGDDGACCGIETRYVVASASSFMYFDRRRPTAAGSGFEERADVAGCAINRYRYGPDDRVNYMRRAPLGQMIESYRRRDVVYLVGIGDTETGERCAENAQGANRLVRAKVFKSYLDLFFAPHRHRLVLIPALGHESRAVIRSTPVLDAVFRW